MGARRKRKGPPPPRFPRKQWLPGQKPRTEKPKKGKGSYNRRRKKPIEREAADEQP